MPDIPIVKEIESFISTSDGGFSPVMINLIAWMLIIGGICGVIYFVFYYDGGNK